MILELLSRHRRQARVSRLRVACSVSRLARWSAGVLTPRSATSLRTASSAKQRAVTAEEAQVVTVLTSSRYAGLSPKQLVPQLADEGLTLRPSRRCTESSADTDLRTKKRTTARTHVARASTVHQATGPNQVWSWDITWLPTTVRGRSSTSTSSWTSGAAASSAGDRGTRVGRLAAALIDPVVRRGQRRSERARAALGQRHSDAGQTMISTLQWLGIVPSFSRPHVSDDNPYSEALFRTLKHTPAYPRLPFADLAAPPLGRALRRLVQRHASPQRHPLRDARRAASRCERAVLRKRHDLYESS